MEKLDSFAQEEAEMVAVATYVLKEVKEDIDGVGLNSSVWLLRKDGTNELFEQDDLNDLEVLMERFNEVINVAFDAAFDLGGSRPTPTGLKDELDEIQKLYSEWFKGLKERQEAFFEDMINRMDRLRGNG